MAIFLMAPYTLERLNEYAKKANIDIENKPLDVNSGEDEIIEAIGKAPAVIAGSECYTRNVFEKLKGTLKTVIRFGAGYDSIDTKAARDNGIAIMIAGGGNSASVADQAVMLMASLCRQICLFDREMRQGIWSQQRTSVQLTGKTVGLIGFGRIGKIVAQLLDGYRCKLLVHDDYVKDDILRKYNISRKPVEEIAGESDIVSLHVPVTPETKGMINEKFFALMKPTAYIVNTSRGQIVNEKDLIAALQNGQIAGAGLDVFENEPLGDSPLLKLQNVILSPHVSYNTVEANMLTAEITIKNLAEFRNMGTCLDVVN